MKVVIPSTGSDLTAPIHPNFGRCTYFLIVDTESRETQVLENPFAADERDAGVHAAGLVAEHGADAVITVSIGPHATQALSAAAIPIYQMPLADGEVVLERFQAGMLATIN